MSRWDSERAGDPGRVNLRRLFDEIDADGTGRIDMADLQVLAGRLGIRGDADFTVEDKCAVLLDRLDIDADSLVDFDDFCRFVDQYIVDGAFQGLPGPPPLPVLPPPFASASSQAVCSPGSGKPADGTTAIRHDGPI